jgi:hypothetical protein
MAMMDHLHVGSRRTIIEKTTMKRTAPSEEARVNRA